ncbi:MAG: Rieske 2Fe-2S domain-containing protein [Myxococcota bacterium]
MKTTPVSLTSTQRTHTFAQPDRVARGWTWALASDELGRGQVAGVRVLGRDLVVWRGDDEIVRAADAYCPHMGAHLKEGRVDGDGIRCFFHDWKFGPTGHLLDVPCLDRLPPASLQCWPVAEALGLIWVWPGTEPDRPPPYVPGLAGEAYTTQVQPPFAERCHPNVVLINAIDEHHFNTVHDLPVHLYMASDVIDGSTIRFRNTTPPSKTHPVGRWLTPLYAGALTYEACYHSGCVGTITLGPDAAHFHLVFALRLADDGGTEGRRVLVSRKRGRVRDAMALGLTNVVGNYFAKGDGQVFESIRFDFATPTSADHAIIDFVRHVEEQPAIAFGSWEDA